MKILYTGLIALVLSLFVTSSTLSPAYDDYIQFNGNMNTVYQLTNDYRHTLSLEDLKPSKALTEAAQNKANDFCLRHYWDHDLPDGKPWYYFVDKSGYNYANAGENLSKGYSSAGVVKAWQNSPPHDKNMRKNWKNIGLAQSNCDGKYYIVAEYAN